MVSTILFKHHFYADHQTLMEHHKEQPASTKPCGVQCAFSRADKRFHHGSDESYIGHQLQIDYTGGRPKWVVMVMRGAVTPMPVFVTCTLKNVRNRQTSTGRFRICAIPLHTNIGYRWYLAFHLQVRALPTGFLMRHYNCLYILISILLLTSSMPPESVAFL